MHKPWLMYSLELKVSVIFLNNPILPIISKCHQQQFVPRVHCALCLIGIVQNRLHICNLYRKPCISSVQWIVLVQGVSRTLHRMNNRFFVVNVLFIVVSVYFRVFLSFLHATEKKAVPFKSPRRP